MLEILSVSPMSVIYFFCVSLLALHKNFHWILDIMHKKLYKYFKGYFSCALTPAVWTVCVLSWSPSVELHSISIYHDLQSLPSLYYIPAAVSTMFFSLDSFLLFCVWFLGVSHLCIHGVALEYIMYGIWGSLPWDCLFLDISAFLNYLAASDS